MGKGTKKKTVWRTFSFENGDSNKKSNELKRRDDDPYENHDASSICDGKLVRSWRSHRKSENGNENYPISKFADTDVSHEKNGHRPYFKRSPLTDKYPFRTSGSQKTTSYSREIGFNLIDENDIPTNKQNHFYGSNRLSKDAIFNENNRKWFNRNRNCNTSELIRDYGRGLRKYQMPHSNRVVSDDHLNGNARNVDETSFNVNENCYKKSQLNEDEYTRISTPRSEVLFKKGYLTRDKKYPCQNNTTSLTTTSSNDSGSVSNGSILSLYPEDSGYPNDFNSVDAFPNDGFDHDLSLFYSSGFYDNSGYFYVNPYGNFDQFKGTTFMMPCENRLSLKDSDSHDTDVDSGEEQNTDSSKSFNSEEMSNSSLSENASLINDLETPSTPPSSISSSKAIPESINNIHKKDEKGENVQQETDRQNNAESIENANKSNEEENKLAVGGDDIADYSMPYYPPIIFVPPIPFVPDVQMANSKHGKFRRYSSNNFKRSKRNNRSSQIYNKLFIPTNWSEAPDEMPQKYNIKDEIITSDEKFVETAPTIEDCDKILQNSKLNSNVSEFVPQSKRMIFLPITSPSVASVYFVPFQSTESTLNVNVPEFLPKNYKPVSEIESNNGGDNPETQPILENETIRKTNETIEDRNDLTNNGNLNNETKHFNINLANHQTTKKIDTQGNPADNAVFFMSDLLRGKSNNNKNASSFNKEDSHVNLKADVINKNVSNIISRNRVYKNSKDINSSDSVKTNNSSKHGRSKFAYPSKKDTLDGNAWKMPPSKKIDQIVIECGGGNQESVQNERGESCENPVEKLPLTYAEMVVPKTHKAVNDVTMDMVGCTKPRPNQNAAKSGNKTRKNLKKNVTNNGQCQLKEEPPTKRDDKSIEWFMVGAKGKKSPLSDCSTNITTIENQSKIETDMQIDQVLSVETKDDSNSTIDIIDSSSIAEENANVVRKKKTAINKNKTKKKIRDKDRKHVRQDTFAIIEPTFESQNGHNTKFIESKTVDTEGPDNGRHEDSQDNITFDSNVFASPCNLLQYMASSKSSCSLRLSTGKVTRNLINQFDIYQHDDTSDEDQQLKQEEEIVIKVLQQLNKSCDKIEMLKTEEPTEADLDGGSEPNRNIHLTETVSPTRNNLEQFAINAKPQQHFYSSNHFLEHFFGDRNDKCDQNGIETNLSSSITSSVEEKKINDKEVEEPPLELAESRKLECGNERENEQTTENDDRNDNIGAIDHLKISSDVSELSGIVELCDSVYNNVDEDIVNDSENHVEKESMRNGKAIEREQISFPEMENGGNATNNAASNSCIPSNKTHSINGPRPWLQIVDTNMLQHNKKLYQTFPITTAVSLWLTKAQQFETVLRLPRKTDSSQISHSSSSSIDLTEDTASIASDKFPFYDDEEEDIANFWESPSILTPEPPTVYHSVYGSSINYSNLISNKNELLCNNIIDFDRNNESCNNIKATPKDGDEKCFRPPPEICCSVM